MILILVILKEYMKYRVVMLVSFRGGSRIKIVYNRSLNVFLNIYRNFIIECDRNGYVKF